MKEEIIKRIIYSFLEKDLPEVIERKVKFQFLENLRKVYTIIWPRRSWKTYFCYQIIKNLIKEWVSKKNILYFNLESDEIFPSELNDLNIILDSFLEITKNLWKNKVYIFLDEIQEVPNWEKFVRKVLDNFDFIEIIITGSSSTLLSKEIATSLRWRSLVLELLPLTFEEYFLFKKFEVWNKSHNNELLLKILKKENLLYWTFPEVCISKDENVKKSILWDYFNLIFYKDIVERNNFKSLQKLKIFRNILISYIWDYISINNISKKIKVENNTISNWLNAFIDSYFIFELKKLDFSILAHSTSQSKIYVIDNWFYTKVFWELKTDYPKLLENLVFLELRKSWFIENENLFYFITKSGYEIDFITLKEGVINAYQVSYNIENEKTREREIRALLDLREQFWEKISNYYIITYDRYSKNEIDWIKILEIQNFLKKISIS